MDKFYSRTEAAKLVGVSQQALARWEKAGKVQAPKRLVRTNQRRYTDEDIKRLVEFSGKMEGPVVA